VRIAASLLVAAAAASFGGRAEAAPTYPWCAHYMMPNAPHNCGFVTFAQCQATVSGIGGTCNPNPWYEPPPARAQKRKAPRT
jgi:hypothetical protein